MFVTCCIAEIVGYPKHFTEPNIFNISRGTLHFITSSDQKVRQFSGCLLTLKSQLKDARGWQFLTMKDAETLCIVC